MSKTTTTKHHALRNNIRGFVTIFSDHSDEHIIVTVVDRSARKTLSTTRMPRAEARDEWSAMRAHCTPVNAEAL